MLLKVCSCLKNKRSVFGDNQLSPFNENLVSSFDNMQSIIFRVKTEASWWLLPMFYLEICLSPGSEGEGTQG
jgi:hypothetical protein